MLKLKRVVRLTWGRGRSVVARRHVGVIESASLASARLDTKALTSTTSRASVKGDSFLGQPHHGHGRPVSAPNDTHPHWGGVVGGDAMRDAQADVPSAEWLRAQTCPRYPLPRVVYGLMRGPTTRAHTANGATQGRALLKFGFPWHMPFSGVEFSRRRRRRTAHVAAILTLHRTIQSVGATGGVYKGQGRSQRELMTRAY
ncbi:hypothetical protein L6452_45072 [Arctium lappa]|nr:hypothetical protein L6452_45072 [Arctium lappa]